QGRARPGRQDRRDPRLRRRRSRVHGRRASVLQPRRRASRVGPHACLPAEAAQALSAGLRILLVGGAGFLGRHVARAFLAAGHSVSVISRGRQPAPPGSESLIADRRDVRSLSPVLEGRRWDFTVDLTAYDAGDIEKLLLVPYSALGRYVMISTGQVYLVT